MWFPELVLLRLFSLPWISMNYKCASGTWRACCNRAALPSQVYICNPWHKSRLYDSFISPQYKTSFQSVHSANELGGWGTGGFLSQPWSLPSSRLFSITLNKRVDEMTPKWSHEVCSCVNSPDGSEWQLTHSQKDIVNVGVLSVFTDVEISHYSTEETDGDTQSPVHLDPMSQTLSGGSTDTIIQG